ncbi:Pentatricopeptide repeat-containing protein [Platanthera guangdongensis]|uniref:Pentatricopeptide repeat-containing protein n=1 Tax=Platanthera guangdongensis TaxID=2320717 RepID=A0ABR2M8V7_9ASPA
MANNQPEKALANRNNRAVDAPSTAATGAARTFPFSSQAPAPSDKHRRPTPPQPCQSNSTSSAAISNTAAADAADLLNLASSSLSQLRRTHAHLLRRNALLHNGDSIPSLLVSLYASLSSPSSAFSVVASATNPSIYLFNRAIRTLSKSRLALRLYARMPAVAVAPDNFTFPFALNTCAALSDLPAGAELHSRLLRTGFAGHLPVANALVDMYGKCAQLPLAGRVFDEMPLRDLVSNNAILGAHARLGQDMLFARKVFDAMPERNIISWNAMIVGYMNVGNLAAARAVFDAIPARNPVSWMVMILGCCKNGRVDAARQLFDEMPQRNLVSWTVIITGYSQSGRAKEALALFHDMQRAGVQADAATMTCVISAVAQLGSAELACWAGAYVDQNGIDRNAKVLTALVDMYAKCGEMKRAIRHFREIPSPDAFSYTVLINALASNGHCLEALEVFERMLAEAIRPDPITFIGVLSACGHEGLVEDGLRYWHSMAEHGINPCADHYSCVIDMLGRAGRLDEANEMMRRIPGGAHVGALGAMLSACRTYGNVEIGEDVARKLFVLEPDNTGNYVLLSSIYAEKGLWDEARRKLMKLQKRSLELAVGKDDLAWAATTKSRNRRSPPPPSRRKQLEVSVSTPELHHTRPSALIRAEKSVLPISFLPLPEKSVFRSNGFSVPSRAEHVRYRRSYSVRRNVFLLGKFYVKFTVNHVALILGLPNRGKEFQFDRIPMSNLKHKELVQELADLIVEDSSPTLELRRINALIRYVLEAFFFPLKGLKVSTCLLEFKWLEDFAAVNWPKAIHTFFYSHFAYMKEIAIGEEMKNLGYLEGCSVIIVVSKSTYNLYLS